MEFIFYLQIKILQHNVACKGIVHCHNCVQCSHCRFGWFAGWYVSKSLQSELLVYIKLTKDVSEHNHGVSLTFALENV